LAALGIAAHASAESPSSAPAKSSQEAGAGGENDAAGDSGLAGEGGNAGEAGVAGDGSAYGAHPSGSSSDAERADFGGGAELALVSRFIWRGLALSRGAALEPSVWVSYAGLTAAIWTNVLLASEADRQRLSAVEPELGYELAWGPLRLEPRLTLYWMRDLPEATVTTEARLEAALAVFGPISVTNTHQLDLMATPGAYYGTLGSRVEQHLGRWHFGASFDFGYATAPYNRAYFGTHVAALDLFAAGLSTRLELEHSLYVAANAGLSTLLSSALRVTTDEPVLAYVGLAFGWEE